jgi:hypothetical protein
MGDKQMPYEVTICTGDGKNAGTSTKCFLQIYGEHGHTEQMWLNGEKQHFEPSGIDVVKVLGKDVGKIVKIRLGHESQSKSDAWMVESVKIRHPKSTLKHEKHEHDTRSRSASGTRRTDSRHDLNTSHGRKLADKLKRQSSATYKHSDHDDDWRDNLHSRSQSPSPSASSDSGHERDNHKRKSVHNKKSVQVWTRPKTSDSRRGKHVSSSEHDSEEDHHHSNSRKNSTKHSTHRAKTPGDTAKHRANSAHGGRAKSTAAINKLPKPYSNSESDGEHSDDVKPGKNKHAKKSEEDHFVTYLFLCHCWIGRGEGDGQLVRELVPTDEKGQPLKGALKTTNYEVHVFTSDIKGSGTDANIFCTIYGTNGDTGVRALKDSATNSNKFERGQDDVFNIEAVDLGKIERLKIWHDNAGMGAAWHLDRVEMHFGNDKLIFPCEQWLSSSDGDGQICRDLIPLTTKQLKRANTAGSLKDEFALEMRAHIVSYHVKVATNKERGSGTDANVYVTLYGKDGDTGKIHLKTSLTNKNKFEAGQTDEFLVSI